MIRAEKVRRKIIEFDAETWQAVHSLARDSMKTTQELAEEAFGDLLKKHHRAVTLKEALTASVRVPTKVQPKRHRKSDETG